MKYEGRLYGKIGKGYIPLEQTTAEIDAVAEHIDFVTNQLDHLICLYRAQAEAFRSMGSKDLASSCSGVANAYENAKSMLIEKKPEQ